MLYNDERPRTFDTVVGQEHIVDSIRNQSITGKWFSVYIFAGQYGGGKTTMGRIISCAANCEDKDERGNPCLKCESCRSILEESTTDIIEIDAASNTGVESIRTLKDSVYYMPVNLQTKVYIIDEVHMLSKQSFNALLKISEEPPKNVIFILCTTELNAIPVTIRSRAATYIFEQIPYEKINKKLYEVAVRHELVISDDALTLIAKNAKGSMRDAYSLLEQVTSGSKEKIESDDVRRILGISDPSYLFQLLRYIVCTNLADCIQNIEMAVSMGKNMDLMIDDLLEIVTEAVVAKSTSIDKVHETELYKECLKDIIDLTTVEQLCQIADGLMDIRVENRKCPSKTTVIVGIIRITKSAVTKSILSRLEALESGLVVSPRHLDISETSSDSESCKSAISNVNNEESECGRQQDNLPSEHEDLSINENNSCDLHIDEHESVSEDNVNKGLDELSAGYAISESVKEEQIKEETPKDQDSSNDEKILDVDFQKEFTSYAEVDPEDDEEGIFSILEEFNMIASGSTYTTENKPVAELSGESARHRQLEERLSIIAGEDMILLTALQGCVKTIGNGNLVLKTPLKPVYDIVDTYLKVTQLQDIIVELDPKVVLN